MSNSGSWIYTQAKPRLQQQHTCFKPGAPETHGRLKGDLWACECGDVYELTDPGVWDYDEPTKNPKWRKAEGTYYGDRG